MSNNSLSDRGIDLPFSHKSLIAITHEQNIICSRHLFVGSYLQITWWALGQWKGRKNSSNDNTIYPLNNWGPCFSKVLKLFGPISDATFTVVSSQRRGSNTSNFTVLLLFQTIKTCEKIKFSKQTDCDFGPEKFSGFPRNRPQGRSVRTALLVIQQQKLRRNSTVTFMSDKYNTLSLENEGLVFKVKWSCLCQSIFGLYTSHLVSCDVHFNICRALHPI